MDSDNENQGFEHQQEQFDLIQFLDHVHQSQSLTPSTQQPKQNYPLQPPISTFVQSKNCPTPIELSTTFSYQTVKKQPHTEQNKKSSNDLNAWSCAQQKYLEQQFNELKYKLIYSKFNDNRSNYKFYRQYAKSQYKVFDDQDSIEDSDEDRQGKGGGKRGTREDGSSSNLKDLLKIERIISPIPKQLAFRSNFQCSNLQKVFTKPQPPVSSSSSFLLRQTSSTESHSLLTSSTPNTNTNRIERTYYLILSNDTNTIGYNQWFYFKVMNLNYDKQIKATFVIVNVNKKIISNFQNVGVHCFSMGRYRVERVGWDVVKTGVCCNFKNNIRRDQNTYYHSLQFEYHVKPRDTVYFSLSTPYSFSKLKHFTNLYPQNFSILGHTFCGNPLYLFRIGSQSAKKSILITARQHPSQISSSYVVEGMINRLTKSSLLINLLKKKFQIYVIPMVNPDGVIHGNSRTNLLGFDVNRKWEKQPNKKHSFQVYNIVKILLKRIPPVQYLIDLHGHSKKLNSFAYFSTKKNLATLISLQMAQKLPWFRIEDCQMTMTAPLNTLRWYAATQLNVEKAITIETSIHGWVDEDKKIRIFTPQNLEQIGSTLVDVISRIELQKKSTLKSIRNIKFADFHQSSDSDPQGDYIKDISEQQHQKQKQKQKKKVITECNQEQGIQKRSQQQSPRRVRIKTCSTFYKQTKTNQNSMIRDRIKTEYTIQKLNLNLNLNLDVNGNMENKMPRKKTLETKYYRLKEKNVTSIRRLTNGFNDLSQSIILKTIGSADPPKKIISIKGQGQTRYQNKDNKMCQSYEQKKTKRKQTIIEQQKRQSIRQVPTFDRIIERKSRNINEFNMKRQRVLSLRTRPK